MFDLVKNPRFVCVVNDTSGSDSGLTDCIFGEMAFLIPCIVYNKKKGMGVNIAVDIMSNGFKGFPFYAMFDYDFPTPLGVGVTLGPLVDEAIQNFPEDGYYITKDEFLKAWNEAILL